MSPRNLQYFFVFFVGSILTPLAAASSTPGCQKPSLISAVIYFDIRRISAGYPPEAGSKPRPGAPPLSLYLLFEFCVLISAGDVRRYPLISAARVFWRLISAVTSAGIRRPGFLSMEKTNIRTNGILISQGIGTAPYVPD